MFYEYIEQRISVGSQDIFAFIVVDCEFAPKGIYMCIHVLFVWCTAANLLNEPDDGEVARVYSPYDNFFYNSKSPIQPNVKQHLVGSIHSFRTLKWYIRPHINSKNPSIHLSIVAARNCNSAATLSHLCMELWKNLGMDCFYYFIEFVCGCAGVFVIHF